MNQKVTVEAADIEGVAAVLGTTLVEVQPAEEVEAYPEELSGVLDTLADIHGGDGKR